MNWTQYRVISAVDRARLGGILRSVAWQTKLVEQTTPSRVKDAVVVYLQPNIRDFRVEIGERTAGNDMIVDLLGGFGPTPPEFRIVHTLLTPALIQGFGSRVEEIKDRPLVPVVVKDDRHAP